MQYVWLHRLWTSGSLRTTDGQDVDVLDPGIWNHDAGPDFFNAKVRIGARTWVGNVEIHLRASDWYRHGHDRDRAYDSVALHVVGASDTAVRRPDGNMVPQLELPCAPDLRERYEALVRNPVSELACAGRISGIPQVYISDWINTLAFERLQQKAARIHALASGNGGDWSYAIYITLARALGFGTNAEPFERLALALPLRILRKHCDSPVTLDGLVFGMAGLLDGAERDDADVYERRMLADFRFMCVKFALTPPRELGWKMARMRPANFPHRRLASLAAFMAQGFRPGSELLSVADLDSARSLFDIRLSGYWARRYCFGPETARSDRAFSDASLNTLLINVAAPALYAYGSAYGQERMAELAVDILRALPPEDNRIVRLFTAAGIPCADAFASQALIGLRRCYCLSRKCLDCRLGYRHLSSR